MVLERIDRFLQKPIEQRRCTLRFFARKCLSKLPFAPIRVRLFVPPREWVTFWWSYIAHHGDVRRHLFEYWGDDIGELRFLWRYLQPGMTFLDIGAYHGLYTLIAGKKLGHGGRLVAFEPSPRERRRFNLHLLLNRLSTVTLEPYAVSSEPGPARLQAVLSGFTSMNSLQRPPISDPIQEIPIETIPLDDYLQQNRSERCEVLKVDAEGGELDVFAGAPETLARRRPVIICEVLDWVTRPWGYRAKEIVTHLSSHDYVWYDFRADGSLAPHQPRDAYPEVKNYLAVPREKLAAVEEWVKL